MATPDPTNPLWILNETLDHAPSSVHLISLQGLVISSKVKKVPLVADGYKTGKVETGRVLLDVPVMVARSLQHADPSDRDFLLLVHIRREVVDEVIERASSPIILPGEVRM